MALTATAARNADNLLDWYIDHNNAITRREQEIDELVRRCQISTQTADRHRDGIDEARVEATSDLYSLMQSLHIIETVDAHMIPDRSVCGCPRCTPREET